MRCSSTEIPEYWDSLRVQIILLNSLAPQFDLLTEDEFDPAYKPAFEKILSDFNVSWYSLHYGSMSQYAKYIIAAGFFVDTETEICMYFDHTDLLINDCYYCTHEPEEAKKLCAVEGNGSIDFTERFYNITFVKEVRHQTV